MSSKWRWNSIDLWITEQGINREIKRAELFVLDATESVYHFFGTGSRKYPVKGMIIGSAGRSSFESDAIADTSRTLTTPYGDVAGLKIGSVKFSLHKYAGGTIDGTSYTVDTTPIWDFEAEFITT